MSTQKIQLKKLDREDLETLNEAAHDYASYLRILVSVKNTAQVHIHVSILMKYGYEVFKKLTSHNKESGLNLEVFMAFVALDSLHHYVNNTKNLLHKAKGSRMIEELDCLLPTISDGKKFTVNSES